MRIAILLLLTASGFGPPLMAIEPASSTLATIKRVYVESLGSSPSAIMLHDMIITSLSNSGFILLTENADHADAIMRGTADDQIYAEQHHSSDNLTAGIHSGNSSTYSSRYDHTGSSKTGGLNIGQNESSSSVERRHEAGASVRLVNRDGDVIWSTTQESIGAKFKSSSADVADKVFHKFADDLQRARSLASASPASTAILAGMPAR